jgi:hypothetical protein
MKLAQLKNKLAYLPLALFVASVAHADPVVPTDASTAVSGLVDSASTIYNTVLVLVISLVGVGIFIKIVKMIRK